MRRTPPSSFVAMLLVVAGCSSSATDLDASEARPPEGSEASVTTEAAEFVADDEPPRAGSVADLENPIQILEDGLTFDPAWRADIILTCGPDPETRTIAIFDVETNDRGTAALSRTEPRGGGVAFVETVTVGSIVPAEVELAWAIPGILLGPWPVDTITDTCGDEQARG